MTLSANIFEALLAMDAYNRSYNQGYRDDARLTAALSTRLGNAILSGKADTGPAQAANFAAYAWDVSGIAGVTKVIAYRGTDAEAPKDLSDLFGGWSVGAGFSAGTQADLAAA